MTNSAKFLVGLILFKILLTSTQDDQIFTHIAEGYRPAKHTLVKHLVSIAYKGNAKIGINHFCGGAILNPHWILTAAHCLWNDNLNKAEDPRIIQIVAGTPNRLKKTKHTQIIDVKSLKLHPEYKHRTLRNDIGVLVLKTDIILDNVYAQRILLPDREPKENQSCTTVGWGELYEDGPLPAQAFYIDLNIITRKVCKKTYSDVSTEHICASDPKDIEKNVCGGDSGGPLICDGKVAGVVSYGNGCGEKYGVYTNVWYYRKKFLKKWLLGCQDGITINLINILLLKLLVWIVF